MTSGNDLGTDERRAIFLQSRIVFCWMTIGLVACTCQRQESSERHILPRAANYLGSQFASFSDDSTIYVKALNRAAKQCSTNGAIDPNQALAGIVSHHLFVADLIAEYFLRVAATTQPRRVILLGPNHRARGRAPIAVTQLAWKTPFGMMAPDRAVIAAMRASSVVEINDDAFFMEHSIGALVPFVKRVFPQASIVPVVLLANTPPEACDRLSDWLVRHLDNETLVLASLDFSHYKTAAEAAREDSVTLPILARLDYARAAQAYVDSRATLRVLLRTLARIGANESEILHHTNSGWLSGLLEVPCTSYINMVWKRPAARGFFCFRKRATW